MKNSKKIVIALLSICLSVSALVACQGAEFSPPQEDSGLQSSPVQEESVPAPTPPQSSTGSSSSSSSGSSNPTTPNTPTVSTSSQYISCMGDNVRLRSGAGTEFSVLGTAEKNTRYAVLGKTGEWYKTYYRGKVAYLHASYAAVFTLPKSDNSKVEKVLEEGYKQIGVPYVYGAVRLHDGKGNLLGGFTAQKFDCSSLVQYVFYKGANAVLQVNTRTQVKQGRYVSKGNLQRGDCIYFTNESRQHLTGVERVGHVAIYLGNDYILHTASDYARIEKMSATRWKFYVEARRFI